MANYKRKNVSERKPAKKVRRRRKSKVGLKLFLIVFLLIIAGVGIAVSPICNISKVVVEGNKVVSAKSITDTVSLPIGGNIFYSVNGSLFDKVFLTWNTYKEKLYSKFVFIKSADFRFNLGGKLVVKIIERTPMIYIPMGKKFALVDEDGVILKIEDEKSTDGKLSLTGFELKDKVVGFKTNFKSNPGVVKMFRLFKFFKEYTTKIPAELISKIVAFDVSNPNNLAVEFVDKRKVLLGDIDVFQDTQLVYRFTFINSVFEKLKAGQEGVLDYSTSEDPIWKITN